MIKNGQRCKYCLNNVGDILYFIWSLDKTVVSLLRITYTYVYLFRSINNLYNKKILVLYVSISHNSCLLNYGFRIVHENEIDNKLLTKNNQPSTKPGQNDSSGKMGVLFFKLR